MNRLVAFLFVVVAGWPCLEIAAADTAQPRPNILFILADDLAWSDLGCYGHPWHETPHLDRLAADGMRFTNGYAPAPICSASRASFMTGKTPARLHFEFVTKDNPGRPQHRGGQLMRSPPYTLNLPLAERTVAERLGDAGYHTAFFGKWHLNAHHGRYLGWSPKHGPQQQGFQTAVEDFGSHPYSYRKGNKPAPITEAGQFPVDSMTDKATAFLKGEHDAPFFLMASHFYVHTPVKTPCEWLLKKYDEKIPAAAPNRKKQIAYAAFLETLDHYVGQLLAALDASGHRDDTIVVFTSDNGGHPEFAGNGPLRGSKWNLYEGGVRVPFIVRRPGQVPAGTTNSTPVIGYDLVPTFAAMANAPVDVAAEKLDGQDLTAAFEKTEQKPDRALYWHFPYYHPEKGYEKAQADIGVNDFAVSQTHPHSAVRSGKYKMLFFHEDQRTELYDLSKDIGEQQDIIQKTPAVAEEMRQLLATYLDDADARLPRPLQTKASGANAAPTDKPRKPNILFVYTDDQAPWGFGAAGNPQAHTPNIDRLADQGARFTNAFVTTPVCSPARASLMTSRYASEYGILDFIPHPGHKLFDADKQIGLDPQSVTFAEVLKEGGYATGLIGKWHLGDWTAAGHRDYHPTQHGFDYFMGLTGGGTTPDDPPLEEHGEVRKFQGLTTDILTDRAISYIKDHAEEPFLLCLNYRAPHGRWLPVADADWAPYEDLDPVLPHPDYPDLDVKLVKRKMREYLASISGVDRNLGRVLRTLDALDIADDTVVIYTSDHGYNMGHNGIHHKGNGVWATKTKPESTKNINGKYRPNLYDNSLKVPAIVRWPGVVQPGMVIEDSTTSLDWYPSLVEMAGAQLPEQHTVRGRSLVPLLRGESVPDWDQNVYAEYSMINYCRAFMRTYRTPEWKLVRDFLDPARDELYHLSVDPEERVNLIGEDRPEIHKVIAHLDREIRRNMNDINDPLLKTIQQKPSGVTP